MPTHAIGLAQDGSGVGRYTIGANKRLKGQGTQRVRHCHFRRLAQDGSDVVYAALPTHEVGLAQKLSNAFDEAQDGSAVGRYDR
jgi:hypothetical protein